MAKTEDTQALSPSEVRTALARCFAVKRPVFLWGPPGIGKSELIAQISNDMGGVMFDLRLGQMEPTDIRGIPFYHKEMNTMDWAQPIDLPNGQNTVADVQVLVSAISEKLTEHMADKLEDLPSIVLFLDEMNSAPPSVLAAAYQLILNRRIGKYKLPDNTVIVAAGNRESDKGVTFRMPLPLANRFVHLEMKHNFDDWFNWAIETGVHSDVVAYLANAKQDLFDFDTKAAGRAFATPRSWSFVSDLIDDNSLSDSTVSHLVSGTVGEGLGVKFMGFRKVAGKLPKPIDILEGKVTDLSVKDISAMYSLVISMCYELREAVDNNIDKKEFSMMADNFLKYMMDNFETEVTIMGTRIALTTYDLPMNPPELKHFKTFNQKYGKYILDGNN